MPKKTFVANWKMQVSFHEALDIIKTNMVRLNTLSSLPEKEVILCPSFTELYAITLLAQDTTLQIGAQDVSAYASGAYTGQISATSLAEIGCTYCIVGHSEARKFLHETNEDISEKCAQLFSQGITPIVCIGESHEQYTEKKTLETLEAQLKPIFKVLAQTDAEQEYVIGYEPVWAIGSGNVPTSEYLNEIFAHLHALCSAYPQPFRLLYGGSVHPENASELLAVKHVDGLLIGGASLNIDSLEAIIHA